MAKFQVQLGSDWADFGPEANRLLETAILAGEPGLQLNDRGQHYLVDFLSMTQRNTATGREREIRVTFSEESKAREVAERRARAAADAEGEALRAAAERDAAAVAAAAEEARRRREQAEREALEAAAAAAAEQELQARKEAEARAAAEAREQEEREEAAAREALEREAAAAREAAEQEEAAREAAEREAVAAREAAEREEAAAREAEERGRKAEAAAEEERKRLEAVRGDKLARGVELDEEASVCWRQGRLEEAQQRLRAATALLTWVHRWDPRTKNPKVQALVGERLKLLEQRSEQLEDELRLPPLASGAATATPAAAVPAASVAAAPVEAPAATGVAPTLPGVEVEACAS